MRSSVPLSLASGFAILCGGALSLPFTDVACFPAWFGLAPLFYLAADAPSKRRAAGLGFLFGLVWSLLCLRFYLHQSFMGWIAGSLYTALYYLAALLAIRWLARRSMRAAVFGTAAVWVLVELARSRIPILGFPWMLLGHATVDAVNLRQGADLLGVYGLSFLVAAVNAAVAFVLTPMFFPALRAPEAEAVSRKRAGLAVAGLMLAAQLYGAYRVHELESRLRPGPLVASIQGCEYLKVGRSAEEKQRQLDEHLVLHAQAAQSDASGRRPDLIAWAETMVPGAFNLETYGLKFTRTVREHGIPTVFGSDWIEPQDFELPYAEQRWYNSAFALDASGRVEARYAKRRLVPFGEYIPLTESLPFLKALRSVTRDSYRPGEGPSPLVEWNGCRFAFNLCIEDAHPDLAREAAQSGASLLLNLTNDGWFKDTFGPAAHLQAARLRAVEVRRPLLRATNTGITCLVDPLGRLEVPVPPDQIGVARLHVQWLEAPPVTLTLWFGEVGVAVLMFIVLTLCCLASRKGP